MGRTTCVMCGASLHESRAPAPKPENKSSIGGFIGIVLGIFVFQAMAPYIFESGDSINYMRIAAAALFGAIGAYFGRLVEKPIRARG